jgi:hypothetical protein
VKLSDEYRRQQRLYEILLEHLEAAERGEAVERSELLARHPEFVADLRRFLEARDWLEGLIAPSWRTARPVWPGRILGLP